MKREIVTTDDGSKTIFFPELNESYHSRHGALQEAKHVFIASGWNQIKNSSVAVLEIGFGSGLNALLTYIAHQKDQKTVHYTGLEAFPLQEHERSALEYTSLPDFKDYAVEFQILHESPWNEFSSISDTFKLKKVHKKLGDFNPVNSTFDLIYFDAFGPRVQPEMWTEEVFHKMYKCTSRNGILITYSAKGSVRRGLIKAGYSVEKIPGPPGKREMLRAKKTIPID